MDKKESDIKILIKLVFTQNLIWVHLCEKCKNDLLLFLNKKGKYKE